MSSLLFVFFPLVQCFVARLYLKVILIHFAVCSLQHSLSLQIKFQSLVTFKILRCKELKISLNPIHHERDNILFHRLRHLAFHIQPYIKRHDCTERHRLGHSYGSIHKPCQIRAHAVDLTAAVTGSLRVSPAREKNAFDSVNPRSALTCCF